MLCKADNQPTKSSSHLKHDMLCKADNQPTKSSPHLYQPTPKTNNAHSYKRGREKWFLVEL